MKYAIFSIILVSGLLAWMFRYDVITTSSAGVYRSGFLLDRWRGEVHLLTPRGSEKIYPLHFDFGGDDPVVSGNLAE